MIQYIPDEEEKYIRSLLDRAEPHYKENGLEKLCELYRRGFILMKPLPVLTTIIGLLHHHHTKVKRWALNCYALVGKQTRAGVEPILDAIQNNEGEPEILSAAFAALFAICPEEKALAVIKEKNLPIEGPFLVAAAQYSKAMSEAAVKQKVNIDTACPVSLKNSAILIGLNKAPENLFEPNHANKAVIGRLNKHDDKKVVQYSVWAMTVNPELSMADIGLDVNNIDEFPENVRGWLYKLMVETSETAQLHHEYIREVGANDNSIEARLGLAGGLKGIYFSGLEETTRLWASTEADMEVEAMLYEHMASTAIKFPPYMADVIKKYEGCGADTLERLRLESAAKGTPLFAELKKISINEERGKLFGSEPMMSTTFNFGNNTNVQNLVSANSISGTTISAVTKVQNEELRKVLEAVTGLLKDQRFTPNQLAEGQSIVVEVADSPTPTTMERLSKWLNAAGAVMVGADSFVGKIQEISNSLMSLIGKI